MGWLRNNNVLGLALASAAFVVYILTLAPAVNFIDSGELAAVASTLGVAHPTGYPLFTLLGWLFAHLPLGLRTIYQLNLMSALLCSMSIFFFYRLFLFLFSDDLRYFAFSKHGKTGILRFVQYDNAIAAAEGVLVLGFSETFWSQAVSIEVYSLHLLCLSIALLLFVKAICEKLKNQSAEAIEGRGKVGLWEGFAFVLGLSFTNHMTTILLAPGFLYLYFTAQGFSRKSWKKIALAAIPFAVGLSVYFYLPLRAAQEPLLNWGNPVTWERLWWHFSAKQYRVWIFSSFDSAGKQFQYFIERFPAEFAYLPLVFALPGVVYLFRNARKMFYFTALLFLSCVLYSINYDIHDIDSYFLLAYIAAAVWIAVGIRVVLRYAERFQKKRLASLACLVIAALPLYRHYAAVDESQNYAVEDYAKNMFESLEPNALILSYQWDYFISASYYYQLVEGVRKDVAVIDKELLRRSWYFKQLQDHYPWLIENSRGEVEAFLKELDKFEHDLPYNSLLIQTRFEEMIRSFLTKNYETRPVYVTHEIEPEFIRGFQKIPAGLAFRLSRDSTRIHPRGFDFRPLHKRDKYSETVRTLYAVSYTNQGIYLGLGGDKDKAREYLQKALNVKSDFRDAIVWMQRFGFER